MSIKNRQLTVATAASLQKQLRSGSYPDLATVQRVIYQMFKERPAGLSRYAYQEVVEDTISNPKSFNDATQAISEDLAVAFAEVSSHADQMIAMANTYDTEKKRINILLRNLENRMSILDQQMSWQKQNTTFFDTFDTFDQVQLKAITGRDIPGTTAFVDLKNGQVTLEKNYANAVKYNLGGIRTSVKVTKGTGKGVEIMPLAQALKDSINETWHYVVTSSASETVQVTMLLELPELITISDVLVQLHSPRETTVQLSISKDNITFKNIGTFRAYDAMQWYVAEEARYVQFTLQKDEPDYVIGTTYEYHFGAQNISVNKDIYFKQGVFVSQPHEVNDQIVNQIALDTDSVIFPQTNIQYYVGIDNNTDLVEWQRIEPGIPLETDILINKAIYVDDTAAGYGVLQTTEFGIPYYAAVTLAETPEALTTKVYTGAYMWQMDTKDLDGESRLPTLADWLDTRGTTTRFVPIENTMAASTFTLTADSLQRFTTHVYAEGSHSILNNELNTGTAFCQVYLNNTLLKPIVSGGVYKYNYHLQSGWNKIQILTCSSTVQPFKPNLYLRNVAKIENGIHKVYAVKESMKEISLYDLYNNTSKRDTSKFAIDDHKVIVNYDPAEMDVSGTGVRYAINYAYAPEDAPRNSRIRLMAVLTGSDLNMQSTPILKSYQLVIR